MKNAWIATIVLTIAYVAAYIDRHVLSLMVEPIKESLHLSDTMIGLINSLSFSLCMIVATLPLAKLADTGNRVSLMTCCVAVWSMATVACGWATTWIHLLLARIGVAAAEAGLPPAALSYFASVHDRRQLPRATAFFMVGPFVGGSLAMFLAGALYAGLLTWDYSNIPLVGQLVPWQMVFVIVGAGGLPITLAIWLLVREVPRPAPAAGGASWRELTPFLAASRSFLPPYVIAIGLVAVSYNAQMVWLPALLMRNYGLTTVETGAWVGSLYLLCGIGGNLLAGWLLGRFDERRLHIYAVRMVLGAACLMIPVASFAPIAPSLHLSLLLFALSFLLNSGIFGIAVVPHQIAAPVAIRSRVIAIHSVCAMVIGTGGGPVLAGILSDHMQDLGRSLAIICLLSTIPAVLLLWRASKGIAGLQPARGDAPAETGLGSA